MSHRLENRIFKRYSQAFKQQVVGGRIVFLYNYRNKGVANPI